MLVIFSQSEKQLVFIENIESIIVDKNSKEDKFNVQYKGANGKGKILGKYNTENRALEVLKEIKEHFNNYEMPKE